MTPTYEAQRNHDMLFPSHVSTLAQTDPELIEYFDNFAFADVLRETTMEPTTRLMVQLASMIASQALSEFRVMVGAALTVGVTPVEIKEVVYQAVPYVGMAKVFDFIHATNEVFMARGIDLPLPRSPPQRRKRGRRQAWPFRNSSSAPRGSRACMPVRRPARSTSSGSLRRTASATITRARESTFQPASS
jgi:4-carboxymuconolactone decarboxylase